MTFTPPQSNPVAVEVPVGSTAVQVLVVSGGGNGYLNNAGQEPVWYGTSSGVTTGTGTQLLPNAVVPLSNSGTYYAITAAGTVTVVQGVSWPQSGGSGSGTSNLVNAVTTFGFDNTGTTDNAAKFNSAIATLAGTGNGLYLPQQSNGNPGIYNIASTVTIGNATTSATSTYQGVPIVGAGFCGNNVMGQSGPYAQGATVLRWTGGTTGKMMVLQGPLLGWQLQHLYFDGATNPCQYGLYVYSGQYGLGDDLMFDGFTACGLTLDCANFATGHNIDVNTMHNRWNQIGLRPGNGGTGMVVGQSGGAGTQNGNTCYEDIQNVSIRFQNSNSTTTTGICFAWTDTLFLRNIHFAGPQTATNQIPLLYFSENANAYPTNVVIENMDLAGAQYTSGPFSVSGTIGIGNTLRVTNANGVTNLPAGVTFIQGFPNANPVGTLGGSTPAVPASGTAQTNSYPVPMRVFVNGGTLTGATQINGTSTGQNNGMFYLMPLDTIKLTYSAAPTWTWFGC